MAVRISKFKYSSILLIVILFFTLFFSGAQGEEITKEISIKAKNADIVEILKVISQKTGFSIIPSRSVSGLASLSVEEMNYQDVLEILTSSKDLAYIQEDSTIYVMSLTEYEDTYGESFKEKRKFKTFKLKYAEPETVGNILSQIKSGIGKVIVNKESGLIFVMDSPNKLRVMQEAVKALDEPLEKQVFDLSFIEPEVFKTYVSELITPGVGRIIIDEKTKKGLVIDLPIRIREIKSWIASLTQAPDQVFIEAKILQVTLNDNSDKGIAWEKFFRGTNDLNLEADFSTSGTLSKSGRISVGQLSNDDYNVVLNMLKTQGDVRIVSTPQILVVNNEEGALLSGTKEVYVVRSVSQGETTDLVSEEEHFIDVGIKLTVTPTINSGKVITLKIKPEVSEVTDTYTTGEGNDIPIVTTSEIETTIKVKDGNTVLMGGLTKITRSRNRSGFLKRNILFGALSNNDKDDQVTELIIFITPHIVSGEETILSLRELEEAKRGPNES